MVMKDNLGISYERYPAHGTVASKNLRQEALQKQRQTESDMMIARALQEELDQQEAVALFQQEEHAQSNGFHGIPSFSNGHGRLNSTPHLRPGSIQHNRPAHPQRERSSSRNREDVNEYEV